MNFKKLIWSAGLPVLAAMIGSVEAKGDTITVTNLAVTGTVGTSTQFEYTTDLSPFGSVKGPSGGQTDFFEIKGIQGFVGLASTPGLVSEVLTGAGGTKWNVTVIPAAGAINIRAEYTGTPGYVIGPDSPLLKVSFLDIYTAATGSGLFDSLDHNKAGTAFEGPVSNQFAPAPDPSSGGSSTPLPMAVVGGLGLFGLVGARRTLRSRN